MNAKKKEAVFTLGKNIIEGVLLMQRRVAMNEIGESDFDVYLDNIKFNIDELCKQVKES